MIEAKDLTKRFRDLVAVDRVNLKIHEGEIFGFLGPNGAGKTTLMSMLCTLLNPSSGSARVMGYDTQKRAKEIRSSIGIVFQDPSLDDKLTGRENLEISAALYRVPKNRRKGRINEVLDIVELKDRAGSFVRTYSMGMKRKLEIARALIHRPKILFLDEATLGLDPQARKWVWEHLQALNHREGVTIVLATNYMEEAERLCNRVAILDKGKIIAMNTPKRLKDMLKGDVIVVRIKNPEELANKFQGVDFVKDVKILDERIVFLVENGENAIPKIVALANGNKIESIELHRPTLNDVFLHYTGREIKDASQMKSWGRKRWVS